MNATIRRLSLEALRTLREPEMLVPATVRRGVLLASRALMAASNSKR